MFWIMWSKGTGLRSAAVALTVAAGVGACSPDNGGQTAEESIRDLGSSAAAGRSEPAAGDARAEALFLQGEQAANSGRDDQARKAYDDALAIYRSAGDRSGEGRALLALATLARYTGQGEVAREIYTEARAAFWLAEDRVGEGRVIYAIAELDRARFNNEDALAAFGEAGSIFHEYGEWGLEANAILGVADIERRMGRIVIAENAVERAYAIFEILDDPKGRAAAEQTREELEEYFSEYEQRRIPWDQYLASSEQAHDWVGRARAILGIALLDTAAGRPAAAITRFERSRGQFEELGLPNGELAALAGIGDLERRRGRTDAARVAYENALMAYERTRAKTTTELQLLEGYLEMSFEERTALVLIGLGELARDEAHAASRFEEARALLRTPPPANVQGALLLAEGRVHERAGRIDAAQTSFAKAQATYEGAGIKAGAADAMLARAGLKLGAGDLEAAHSLYFAALDTFLAVPDRVGEGFSRYGLAEVLAASGGAAMEANIQYRVAARIFGELELADRVAVTLAAANALN
jgi:tetratricopeptide (TPR) repeat protein